MSRGTKLKCPRLEKGSGEYDTSSPGISKASKCGREIRKRSNAAPSEATVTSQPSSSNALAMGMHLLAWPMPQCSAAINTLWECDIGLITFVAMILKRAGLILWLIILVFASSRPLGAQVLAKPSARLSSLLTYLYHQQVTQSVADTAFQGEWPGSMELKFAFVMLGKKGRFRDSNAFTTIAVHNALCEVVQRNEVEAFVKKMMDDSYRELLTYKRNGRYYFWKHLKPNPGWGKSPPDSVIRPTCFPLKKPFINHAANVAPDADDTSTGLLAEWWHGAKPPAQIPMSCYTDENRKNFHWYNYSFDLSYGRGAFLTWLSDEHQYPGGWSIYKTLWANIWFFAPWSSCYPDGKREYIPYGANEFDGVVNCNVLTYLGKAGVPDSICPRAGAIRLINKKARTGRWSRGGTYYPNRYTFHLAIARAWDAGNPELNEARHTALKHLLRSQRPDGSYKGRHRILKGDRIQNTLYAALALSILGKEDEQAKKALSKAKAFLETQVVSNGEEAYLPGGVFFSGGTVVRNCLFFRSSSLTTALYAELLAREP